MKYWNIQENEAELKIEIEIVPGVKTLYSYKLNKNTKFILKNDNYITDAERNELLQVI